MTTAIEAQIPERLAQQAQELVRDGWAADFNAVLVEALRRVLESHRPALTEGFLREDVEWGLHGRE
jgi:hypothetical protein